MWFGEWPARGRVLRFLHIFMIPLLVLDCTQSLILARSLASPRPALASFPFVFVFANSHFFLRLRLQPHPEVTDHWEITRRTDISTQTPIHHSLGM